MATVAAYAFEPGAKFPLHTHPQEQITVVLEREVECEVAGKTHELGTGETLVIAPGVEHGIRAGERGARFLAVVVPGRAGSDDYTIRK
jgi:quercetin dioxygenase-like cupin family protein